MLNFTKVNSIIFASLFFLLLSILKTMHTFVDLPLAFRYCRKSNKMSPFFDFGLSTNLYVATQRKGTVNDTTINRRQRIVDDEFKKINFSILLALGAEYDANEIISIFSRASFQLALLANYDYSYTRKYPFSAGFEMGVRAFLHE